MAIVDGRTQRDGAEANTNWVNLSGSTSGTAQSGTAIEGTNALSYKISDTTDGLLWNNGSAADFSGQVVYVWWNVGFGTVAAKASGGVRVRFTGATITDFFEVYVEGGDTYQGGWKMSVVDIDLAASNPSNTGGTPPATSAIQRMGVVVLITNMVTGNNDNVFFDSLWTITKGTAVIRVEGQNSGNPWTWDDVATESANNGWGTCRKRDGVFFINGPIRFGSDNSTQDEFADTGKVIAFEDQQFVGDDHYGFDTICGTGQFDLTAGTKIGSGQTAVGVNGWTILSSGSRWSWTSVDTDQDSVGLFGCAFSGSGKWDISQTAVEIRSCTFTNCDEITIDNDPTLTKCFFSSAPGPRAQVKLDNAPADGDFDDNTFVDMKWWAIEISENGPVTYNLRNVKFSNNGTDRDVLLTHGSGTITLAILEGGDNPGVANGATVTVTTVGTSDIFVTAVSFDDVNQTTPVPETAGNSDSDPETAVVTPDATDNYAVAFYHANTSGSVDWSGGSTYDEQNNYMDAVNTATVSTATKTGVTGAQTASADLSVTPTNNALAVVEIDGDGAAAVTVIDPEFRPVEGTLQSTTHVFGYGVGATQSNRLAVVMVATNDPTTGDTDVSSVSWGGTNMDQQIEQAGGSGAVRATVFTLDDADMEVGDFVITLNPVATTITVKDNNDVNLQNARVLVEAGDGTGDLPFEDSVTITHVTTTASVSHTAHGLTSGDKVAIRGADQLPYNGVFAISNVATNSYDYTMGSDPGTNATGTITSTGVVVEGLTNASGQVTNSMSFSVDQNVRGVIRKASATPFFKLVDFNDVVDKDTGLTKTVQMVLDE